MKIQSLITLSLLEQFIDTEPPNLSAKLLIKVELVIVIPFPSILIAPPSNFAEQLMNLQLLIITLSA